MDMLDKVILALRCHYEVPGEDCIDTCPYSGMGNCLDPLMKDCLEVLRGRYDLEIQLDVAREKLNILRAELAEERERSARWLRESEPVVHAHWADRYGGKFANPLYECSGCLGKALFEIKVDALGHEHIAQMLSNYCPHCGAHMDEEVAE